MEDIFTPREQQVMALVREGLPPKDIAARLGIARRTAEIHLSNVYRKLGIRTKSLSRKQLLAIMANR